MHTHNEKYLLPSHTALKLQWLRAVWVVHMRSQAGNYSTNTRGAWVEKIRWHLHIQLGHGRKYYGNTKKLTKGCACKKNKCTSKQCGCRQKGLIRGPGCQCINCKNVLKISLTHPNISCGSKTGPIFYKRNRAVTPCRRRSWCQFETIQTASIVTQILTLTQPVVLTVTQLTTCNSLVIQILA